MTELAAAIARADGGCSCRSSTVPCTMHHVALVETTSRSAAVATAFDVVQAAIARAYFELGGGR